MRALQCGEARAFGIPLMPADLNSDAPVFRVEVRKTEIAGSEIKLFVIQRIIWNVHFAIFAEERAIGIEHGAAVVINAGGAPLEKRNDKSDVTFLGGFRERIGGWTGNGFGEIEKRGVFRAAEILASKKLVHADDLRAAFSRLAYFFDSTRQIFRSVLRAAHLNQANSKFIQHEKYRNTLTEEI